MTKEGYDESGNEMGYYTREPDGVSGMTVSALADFCGTKQPVITNLLNQIENAHPDPILNDLSECLKPFAGKDLRLISNDLQGRRIVPDEACQAIVEYYAFEAREYEGKRIALNNFRTLAKATMRMFIWSKTGYVPPEMRAEKQRGSYWYKRIGLALTDLEKPLQSGYFCVYVEMMRFFSELEMRLGYVIDDKDLETGRHIVPDISIGKRFNDWLRSDDEVDCQARRHFLGSSEPIDFRPERELKTGWEPAGSHHHEIEMYNHVYPEESHGDNDPPETRSYPNRYKSIFHYYLEEHWIPDVCVSYLQKRDPIGIEIMQKTLSSMSEKVKLSLSGTLVGKLIRSLPPSKN